LRASLGTGTHENTRLQLKLCWRAYASTPTDLYNFIGNSGPEGSVFVDSSGDVFGAVSFGGPNSGGQVFEIAKTTNGYSTAHYMPR
jgi:hypothetical protein